jgi:hypothetical protein
VIGLMLIAIAWLERAPYERQKPSDKNLQRPAPGIAAD